MSLKTGRGKEERKSGRKGERVREYRSSVYFRPLST